MTPLTTSPCHVREAEVAALVVVGQLLMVDAQQVHHGRVQVVHRDRVLGDVVAEVVGLAVVSGRPSRRRPPSTSVKLPPWWSRPGVLDDAALGVGGPAELAAEHHQGVVQQAALLQVGDQRRRGLVDRPAVARVALARCRCGGPSRPGTAGRTSRRARSGDGSAGSCGRRCPGCGPAGRTCRGCSPARRRCRTLPAPSPASGRPSRTG